MLTLKKYANGRFFDIINKQYVTKEQVSKLIEKKEKVKVILAKTGKDVTKSVVSSLPTSKKTIKTQFEDHKKWIGKQIDKRMDTILEMMNFPNKQEVAKLSAEVKKLSKKIDDLQKQQAQLQKK